MSAKLSRNDNQSAPAGDDGFTLVELAVVILIIGILMAFAMPNFLRIQRSAKDKQAQQVLRLAATESFVAYDSSSVTFAGAVVDGKIADGRIYAPADATNLREVSGGGDDESFAWATRSNTGRCYAIRGGVATGTEFAWFPGDGTTCTPDNVGVVTGGVDWNSDSW